jgi:hypothetical protein
MNAITRLREVVTHTFIHLGGREGDPSDIVVFVATFLDLFAAYFGGIAGAMILVQIYKIGVDRFCSETLPEGGQSGIAPTSAGSG